MSFNPLNPASLPIGGNLATGLGAGLALSNFLTLIPQGQIGSIPIACTFEETMTDQLTVTDHPVESGAEITDHSFVRPAELTLRCGWSNAVTLNNLKNGISSLLSGGGASALVSQLIPSLPSFGGPNGAGGMTVSDYVSGIYSQLLNLQQSRTPFKVMTSIRAYNSMVLTSLVITRDQKTSQALLVTATMRQVILVNTTTTTLAALNNQANPASTAETVNGGTQQLDSSVTPAPGGSPGAASWWF